jgi:hypothetical protein
VLLRERTISQVTQSALRLPSNALFTREWPKFHAAVAVSAVVYETLNSNGHRARIWVAALIRMLDFQEICAACHDLRT